MRVGRSIGLLTGLALIITVGFVQVSQGQQQGSAPGKSAAVTMLEPKEAFELIKKNQYNKNFVILDIRTPEEFDSGYIQGAVNINYYSATFVDDLRGLDKTKTYLVYCRTGRRSADAVNIMAQLGFGRIYRIKGDIIEWKGKGLPLVKKE